MTVRCAVTACPETAELPLSSAVFGEAEDPFSEPVPIASGSGWATWADRCWCPEHRTLIPRLAEVASHHRDQRASDVANYLRASAADYLRVWDTLNPNPVLAAMEAGTPAEALRPVEFKLPSALDLAVFWAKKMASEDIEALKRLGLLVQQRPVSADEWPATCPTKGLGYPERPCDCPECRRRAAE